jgi:hypothetical protein
MTSLGRKSGFCMRIYYTMYYDGIYREEITRNEIELN